jgi:hypothetical protein
MKEGTAENTATKPQITRGQLETVAACLEALDIQPVHWGNTVFGRLVGLSIWVGTIMIGVALILAMWRG